MGDITVLANNILLARTELKEMDKKINKIYDDVLNSHEFYNDKNERIISYKNTYEMTEEVFDFYNLNLCCEVLFKAGITDKNGYYINFDRSEVYTLEREFLEYILEKIPLLNAECGEQLRKNITHRTRMIDLFIKTIEQFNKLTEVK